MDDLLKEAIADAKAVRETALENAKIALEEAFTPRLKSMLSRKIEAEMEDEKEMDADEMKMDSDEMEDKDEEDAEEVNYEGEGEDHDEMEKDEMKMDSDEMEKDEEDSEEMAMNDEEEEDELDLEAVLAELEADLTEEEDEDDKEEMKEVDDKDEEEKVDENDVSSDIGKSDNKVNPEANDSSKTGAQGPEGEGSDKASGSEDSNLTVVKEEEEGDKDDVEEDIDLEEVLNALSEEEAEEEEKDEVEELKKEIKETRDVVKYMRAKLNEVNLLNAKLLFSNKLFRAFGLNNDQKLKVVENFDRTKNLREVKLVYATLAESFKKPSKPLSESVKKGSSSKPVASTKPAKQEVLSEGAEMKARFKKLANIL